MREPDPKHSICPFEVKPTAACGALQDKNLMAQRQNFSLQGRAGTETASQRRK
ncbi:MAG TPA: hypothetical protein VIK39_00375 [Candidatus Angelobacter sp.]